MSDEENIRPNTKTTKKAWLQAAQRMLIKDGIGRVKVDRIAQSLHVTRGGFYWFFKNRDDLLTEMLKDWSDPENDFLTSVLTDNQLAPIDRLYQYVCVLLLEKDFNPALDQAMRSWGQVDVKARKVVSEVDNRRICALVNIFKSLGEDAHSALIRARIYYFHQIGYYVINQRDNPSERLKLLPLYFKQLTGHELAEKVLDDIKQHEPYRSECN
ncbi:MAG: TetR/AcrR family transcriptional regulator [Alphaproteobacteria bacterium]|nr:TetR/AcrR family transcriptional regulator [Alphaproteobacteria bacterium]